jgi:3-phenylpropionate/trans-cinnamate dioxygenase ferredoxin reductase component
MSSDSVVIIGAGHAGGTAAALLRQWGHAGPVTLVGEEPIAPYQRPPLSKAWLKGEAGEDDLILKPVSFYAEHDIALRLGVRAVALDRQTRTVTLSDGDDLPYDILIIATGARARKLPIDGADLEGVLELRTAADAERLKAALGPGKRLAVIGGGYIGLEAAASARALGAEVVVIEREARLLPRVAGGDLSAFFHHYHEGKGVVFEVARQVEAITGEAGHVTGVRLSDGRTLPCDAALVGVGAQPNDELAHAAGLDCSNGIVVDLEARTSDPSIYAIGDVTWRPLPLYDRPFRLESVPNALEQARHAASAICGRAAPAPEVPWFWSDQYDLKLQIAGLSFDPDTVVMRGDMDAGRFAVFHLKDGVIVAVEAINSPAEFMAGRLLIGRRAKVDPARLADLSISMKEVAA